MCFVCFVCNLIFVYPIAARHFKIQNRRNEGCVWVDLSQAHPHSKNRRNEGCVCFHSVCGVWVNCDRFNHWWSDTNESILLKRSIAKNQEFTLEVLVCLPSLVAWCVNSDLAPRSVDTCAAILLISQCSESSTDNHAMRVVLAASTTSTNSTSDSDWFVRSSTHSMASRFHVVFVSNCKGHIL